MKYIKTVELADEHSPCGPYQAALMAGLIILP